jgi:hypothetical protein
MIPDKSIIKGNKYKEVKSNNLLTKQGHHQPVPCESFGFGAGLN